MPKRKFDSTKPPCPDPDKFILVRGKYHYFWRRKRGTVKPAVLNEVLAKSAAITKKCNRAAIQLMSLLSVFTQQMQLGRATSRIAGAFKKAYLKTGRMDFSCMQRIEFQEDYPIHRLYRGDIKKQIIKGCLDLHIDVGSLHVIKQNAALVSYQLHAILLYGDPSKDRDIRIETDESRIYTFGEEEKMDCHLQLVLPPKKRPWMALLYIGCKLSLPFPAGSKYHAMMVLMTSGGEEV
jgi:hypothetical protein